MSKRKRWQLDLGATLQTEGTVNFRVWAPHAKFVEVRLNPGKKEHIVPLSRDVHGYFLGSSQNVKAGDLYFYRLDGEKDRPDPASGSQPEGVHGPSEIIDPSRFKWVDSKWKGCALKDFIFYEMHTGTFTSEGTFEGAIKKLPYLRKLGITCLEIMPVAQFPGKRNWGYDGVGLFAVQNSYGGPEGLKKLVNACHKLGIAVCLDVVYNHLGPEGNYLHDYGPYFTNKYHTPWGDALNYDDRGSVAVRDFVLSNVLYWIDEFHIDALRLDAIHSIFDMSAKHILEEMGEVVSEQSKLLKRPVTLIAESDLNDTRIIRSKKTGGYGLDAQWADDFHHSVHVTVTGEKKDYYQDYEKTEHIAQAIKSPFVYRGQYSVFRERKHGSDASKIPSERFVFCLQNHDQVGNRALGDRLTHHISFEAQKATAALLIGSPYIPLLWMGQEYGELQPFQYFIDHSDKNLIKAVREGRRREFASFKGVEVQDPQSSDTFNRSRLNWDLPSRLPHKQLFSLHKDLIALRKRIKPSGLVSKQIDVYFSKGEDMLMFYYPGRKGKKFGGIISFAKAPLRVKLRPKGKVFRELLRTDRKKYGGKCPEKRVRNFTGEIDLPPETALLGEFNL